MRWGKNEKKEKKRIQNQHTHTIETPVLNSTYVKMVDLALLRIKFILRNMNTITCMGTLPILFMLEPILCSFIAFHFIFFVVGWCSLVASFSYVSLFTPIYLSISPTVSISLLSFGKKHINVPPFIWKPAYTNENISQWTNKKKNATLYTMANMENFWMCENIGKEARDTQK